MSWVCLLGASERGAAAVRALGHDLVVLAEPGSVVPSSVTSAARQVVITALTDPAAVITALDQVVGVHGLPKLVVSFTELAQAAAALLARRLRLPAVSPSAVAASRDKAAMRRALHDTRLAWPWTAGTPAELRARLPERLAVRPWLVKPVDGAGSRGVTVLRDPAGLARWTPTDGRYIAEQLAGGPEYSVEAVSTRAGHDVLAITAKHTAGPSFVEVGHVVPAPVADPGVLAAAAREVLDAVGIHAGASHTELRLDPEHGPVVIETHTRPGGDCIPELVELVTGRDQYRCALDSLLGDDSPFAAPVAAAAAVWFLVPPAPGRLTGVAVPPGVLDEVHRFTLDKPIGARLDSLGSSPDRLGHVIALGADATAAIDSAGRCARSTQVTVAED